MRLIWCFLKVLDFVRLPIGAGILSLCCCFAIAAASFLIVSASSGVLAVIMMVITPGFSSRATWTGVSSSSIVIMYLTFGCCVIADCKLTTLAMSFTPFINLCGWVVLFEYVCLLLVVIHPRRVEAAGFELIVYVYNIKDIVYDVNN